VRLGVLTTSYPRAEGDPAGHFVAGFARWLADHGADVDVIAAGERWPFYDGGAPSALRAKPLRSSLRAARFCAALAGAAWRRRRAWDAVVTHWVVPCGVVGAHLGRPHLAIAHGSDVRLLCALPGGRALLRRVAAGGDLVYVAESLRVDGAPGRVVPMGVEPVAARTAASVGAPHAAIERMRARAELGVDGCVALVMARLSPEKGVDLAIDALPYGVTLLVAGAGPERAGLEARVAAGRAVQFLGEVRGARKQALLAAADLMIVPSRTDGAPTVVTEAALASLPLVAARVGGIPELLAEDEALLCNPDVASLRAAVEILRDDPARGTRLAARARLRAEDRTWPRLGPLLAGRLADGLGGQAGEITVTRI